MTTASQLVYSKRAKIYTYDPPNVSLSGSDRKYSGVKLLCVHDKRRYTKKPAAAAAAAKTTPSLLPPPQQRMQRGSTPGLQGGSF